jgi:Zn-dependent protease
MSEQNILLDVSREEEVITVIGSTPVTRKGISWLPITQIVAWLFFTRRASKTKPDQTIFHWTGEGILNTAATLGSEWCHNLAHLIASNLIGKPMDEFRIQFGMPRCIYTNINDQEVTPRQHVVRSLGGPLINLALLPISALFRLVTKPETVPGEAAKTFYQTNLFLSLVSLLPIPGIDGGPILKWSLVDKGHSIEEADQLVRKVNGPLAVFLGLFGSWSFAKKRILAGLFSTMLGLISLGVYAGWLKEEDVPM